MEDQEKEASMKSEDQTNDSFEAPVEPVKEPIPKLKPDWQPSKKKKKYTVRNVILIVVVLFVFLSCAFGGGDSSYSKNKSSSHSITHTI